MSGITNPLEWVAKAEGDYKLALSALHRKEPITFGACFHAQQCAEKYLKALLVARGKTFPKIHDLGKLRVLCEKAGVILPVGDEPLEILSDYAVDTRYPSPNPPLEDAREALQTAQAVRRFARKFLNVK